MRDPDLALYDAACELLAAAQELRRMTERTRSVDAIAPTLGCLQEAVHELEGTYATLRGRTGRDVRHSLDDAAAMLRLADRAAEAAREAAAHGGARPPRW